jgi:UDP-glucose 4-epimerase
MADTNKMLTKLKGKRVLVTGGLGFLGRWVCQLAASQGASVFAFDRGEKESIDGVTVFRGDVLSSVKLEMLIDEADIVIHLAGVLGTDSTFNDLLGTVQGNVDVSAKLIQLCARRRRRTLLPTVGNDWANPYTITRQCVDKLCFMANAEMSADFRVAKIMNAYGPWQRFGVSKKIIPSFVHSCIADEPITIYGTGKQIIDLVHAKDVAHGLLLMSLAEEFPADKPVDLGCGGNGRTVIDVAEMIIQLTGANTQINYCAKRRGERLDSITLADTSALHEISGFIPEIILEDGIIETIAWYYEHKNYLAL